MQLGILFTVVQSQDMAFVLASFLREVATVGANILFYPIPFQKIMQECVTHISVTV